MNHQYLKNVATLNLVPEKCTGCAKYTEVCSHGVLTSKIKNWLLLIKTVVWNVAPAQNNVLLGLLMLKPEQVTLWL